MTGWTSNPYFHPIYGPAAPPPAPAPDPFSQLTLPIPPLIAAQMLQPPPQVPQWNMPPAITARPGMPPPASPQPPAPSPYPSSWAESFSQGFGPQRPDESNISAIIRAPLRALGSIFSEGQKAGRYLADKPENATRALQGRDARPAPDPFAMFNQGPGAQQAGGFNTTNFFRGLERSGDFATSPKGAFGPMQVMPETAPEAARMAGVAWDPKLFKERSQRGLEYNLKLGTAYGNAQLQKYGHPVLAAGAYNAGPGAMDKWLKNIGDPRTGQISITDFINRVPYGETKDYMLRAMQQSSPMQTPEGFAIPPLAFNDQYHRQAMALNEQAGALMDKPASVSWDPGKAPDIPTPPTLQGTDFSKVDEAIAKTLPQEMTDKEKIRTQRRGWLAGIAQGLAATDLSAKGGEGVGSLLAKVGAGALMGRTQADQEIDKREDLYDEQMRQYNMLVARQETVKAEDVAQTARLNAQQAYEHSLSKFKMDYDQWQTQAKPVVQGDRMYITKTGPDGKMTMDSIPLIQVGRIGAMTANAQLLQQIGAGHNAVGQANWQMSTARAMSAAGGNNPAQASGHDMMTAMGIRVGEALQSGMISQLVPAEQLAELQKAATAAAQSQYPLTLQGQGVEQARLEMVQTQMIAGLTALVAQDPNLSKQLFSGAAQIGSGATNAVRYMNRDTRQTTNARGQTSTSVSQ